MIKRIELINFMSHPHTVIEPASGLTVLVGPNNCGKSAVVTALQILCTNENSTYVLRHGERECAVKVETDDGHVVEWRRKTSPRYIIDGQTFDRLKGIGLPEELHRVLRLPSVEAASNQTFDVHFGEQKSPVFLLDKPASCAASFFASSSDAIRLVEMQNRHRQKRADAQATKNRLEEESAQLNLELEALDPMADLDRRMRQVEEDHTYLIGLAGRLELAEADVEWLQAQAAEVTRHQEEADALEGLIHPPALSATEPLKDAIDAMAGSLATLALADARAGVFAPMTDLDVRLWVLEQDHAGLVNLANQLEAIEGDEATLRTEWSVLKRRDEEASAFAALTSPPLLSPTKSLIGAIDTMARAETALALAKNRDGALAHLATVGQPPLLHDLRQLAQLMDDIREQVANAEQSLAEVHIVEPLQEPPPLKATEPLAGFIEQLIQSQCELAANSQRTEALSALIGAPSLLDQAPLTDLVAALQHASHQVERWQDAEACASPLAVPPGVVDTASLLSLLRQLEASRQSVATLTREVENADVAVNEAGKQLRAWATSHPICPTCGNAIEPERFMLQSAPGAGSHSHE